MSIKSFLSFTLSKSDSNTFCVLLYDYATNYKLDIQYKNMISFMSITHKFLNVFFIIRSISFIYDILTNIIKSKIFFSNDEKLCEIQMIMKKIIDNIVDDHQLKCLEFYYYVYFTNHIFFRTHNYFPIENHILKNINDIVLAYFVENISLFSWTIREKASELFLSLLNENIMSRNSEYIKILIKNLYI